MRLFLALFTRVRGRGILRTSPKLSSAKATTRQPQEYPELGTLLAALGSYPWCLRVGVPWEQARHGSEACRLGRLHGEDRRNAEDGAGDQNVQVPELVDRPQEASSLLRRLGRGRRS